MTESGEMIHIVNNENDIGTNKTWKQTTELDLPTQSGHDDLTRRQVKRTLQTPIKSFISLMSISDVKTEEILNLKTIYFTENQS